MSERSFGLQAPPSLGVPGKKTVCNGNGFKAMHRVYGLCAF